METKIKIINKWKLFCLLKPLVCSLIHHFVCIKRIKLDCTKYCITDLSMKRYTAIKCSEVMADHGYVERGGCSDRQMCFIIIKISAYVSPDPTLCQNVTGHDRINAILRWSLSVCGLPGKKPHLHWLLLSFHGDRAPILQMKLRVGILGRLQTPAIQRYISHKLHTCRAHVHSN